MDDLDILDDSKNTDEFKRIPLIILRSSEAEEGIVEGYEKSANAYLMKPVGVDEFVNLARSFGVFYGYR